MIYLYLFGTCFHFIYVFMIIGNNTIFAVLFAFWWKGKIFVKRRL